MIDQKVVNSRLTLALAVTNVGDYVSSIAYGIILAEINDNFLFAGLIWPIRSLSQAIGSLLTPHLIRLRHTSQVMAWSQLLMALLTFFMFGFLLFMRNSKFMSYFIIVNWVLLSLLSQIFVNLREVYSKELEKFIKPEEGNALRISRSMQIRNELGQFFGQFAGPMVFLFVIYSLKLDIIFTLLIDGFSFVFAWLIIRTLPGISTHVERENYRSTFKMIFNHPSLRSIFLVRAILFWVSMGIFNLILVPLPVSTIGLDLRLSPLIYTAIGLGGILFTQIFEKFRFNGNLHRYLHSLPNPHLAVFGTTLYSVTLFLFAFSMNWLSLTLSLILIGVGNGFQRISTRGIVREICNESQIKNVFGLEFFIGRLTDFIFSIGAAGFLFSGISIQSVAVFAAIFVLLAIPFFISIHKWSHDEKI